MWLKDLGNLYNEGWNTGGPSSPGDARNSYPAHETATSLRMKGVFGSGDSPANMSNLAMTTMNVPTMEQEEGEVINKNDVLSLIRKHISHLDNNNRLDKSGILHFGYLLNDINKL